MKESELIALKRKVDQLNEFFSLVAQELTMVKDLSIGTLELVKRMDQYKDAVEKLKQEYTKTDEQEKPAEVTDN